VEPATFRPFRNLDNEYLIDREQQRTTSYTGILGVSEQDAAVQESMGPVVDRTLERLGASDTAVIAARRLLLREVKQLQQGKEPYASRHPEVYRVRSASVILDREVPMEEGSKVALAARV
jgi:hypothetical protein